MTFRLSHLILLALTALVSIVIMYSIGKANGLIW